MPDLRTALATRFRRSPGEDHTPSPADAAPTDAAPTDAAPTDAAPTDAAPTDAAPTDIAKAADAETDAAETANAETADAAEAVDAEADGARRTTARRAWLRTGLAALRTVLHWVRVALGRLRSPLAALLVLAALLLPDDMAHLKPAVFLRLPVEALLAIGAVLVLPARARRAVAAFGGVGLGLLTILKIADLGFSQALDRPFDLVLDWGLLGDAVGVLMASVGKIGAVVAVVVIAVFAVGLLVVMARSAVRLANLMVRHNTLAARGVAVSAVVWLACGAFGADLVPGLPIAARSDAALVYHRTAQARATFLDKRAFEQEAAVDPFRNTPASSLLTGLRGKDVIFSFVESYGRSAIEDPRFAPQVNAVLDAGTRRLTAAGFSSRSGFLTSSTAGGGSWLAHASLFSGLWVNNAQRYSTLVKSGRLTLPSTFRGAGWRTVSLEPAIIKDWPEKSFYQYDRGYAATDLEYHGPHFSYATMPDQYTLEELQRSERWPGHAPLMAEVTMVSSHNPWTPIPKMVDWNKVGNGSVYYNPANRQGGAVRDVWRSPDRIRTSYRDSIEYSLNTLISYLEKYGDKNLVMVFLGDHQPAPLVVGPGASRDVPVTIVARDPAVLQQISSWGWQPGLRPAPNAPVWRMNTFRDKFLTAFSGKPAHPKTG